MTAIRATVGQIGGQAMSVPGSLLQALAGFSSFLLDEVNALGLGRQSI